MVAAGGVAGAEARYGVSMVIPVEGGFPWATLVVNVTGCLLIGLLMVVIFELTAPHRLVRPFLAIGVLGGYTTFSTYAVDVYELLMADHPLLAVSYLVTTPVLALVATWAGMAAARTMMGKD